MASFYEENPEAFAEAAKRRDFEDHLLEGTGLQFFLACDPDNVPQAKAQDDLRVILDRAWQAQQQAREAVQTHALVMQ